MMIKSPTSLRIFVPSTIEKLDQTAEPTLETLTGEDYLGTSIASGGHCVNAMDGYPHRPFQSDTNTSASTWRIDAALDQREKAGFVIVDQHNLRDVYAAATKSQTSVHHHTSDSFAGSTEVDPSLELSGMISKVAPRLSFVDDNSEYITISSDSKLNIDNHNFTIIVDFEMSESVAITGSMVGSGLGQYDWFIITRASGYIWLRFKNTGGTTYDFEDYPVEFDVNNRVRGAFVGAWDGDSLTVYTYKNGAVVGSQTRTMSGRFNTGSIKYIWRTVQTEGELNYLSLYNRSLSAEEILNDYSLTSIQIIDKWGSPEDLLGSNNATSDFQTEANATTGWTDVNATSSSVDSTEGFSPHNGTYMLKTTSLDVNMHTYQSFTTVVGKQYRVSGWLRDTAIANGSYTLRIGTSAGGNTLGESSALSANDTWQYREVEFTATGTTTYVSLYKTNTGGPVSIYADGVRAMQIGCVAEYDPSGINQGDGKWYDSSDNSLDGTITGAKYIDVPIDVDDFYLAIFDSEVDARYWFVNFNADGLTGADDALIGQIAFGKVYSFNTELSPSGGYSGNISYGIDSSETDAGYVLAEERYGERPSWSLAFAPQNESDYEKLQEMLGYLRGSKYPFWICFNYDSLTPVIHRVRVDDSLDWSYNYGSEQPWNNTLNIVEDL